MKTIAIMQPTYLPWMGYFDMLDQADLFVFLDAVQFNKRSWQQRNRVKAASGPVWLTVPVITKGRGEQAIEEALIDPTQAWAEKHIRTIRHCYAKAAFLAEYFDALSAILREPAEKLADLNVRLISWISAKLGIDTPTRRSSEMELSGAANVELLIEICRKCGGDCYLSAAGSESYIGEGPGFQSEGIRLRYHAYEHPRYRQLHGDFLSHLSVVDLLLNEGPKSLRIIRSGRKEV